jgi:hypothetical protein
MFGKRFRQIFLKRFRGRLVATCCSYQKQQINSWRVYRALEISLPQSLQVDYCRVCIFWSRCKSLETIMANHRGIVAAAAVVLSILASQPTPGVEGKESKPSFLTCAMASGGGEGESAFGLCNGCVLIEDGRPVACFGFNKRPKERGRYIYLILFRAPAGASDFKIAGSGRTSADRATREDYVVLGGKRLDLTYQFTADEKTHAMTSEALKIGGKEIKEGDPRVFLVDLTQEKVVYEPVKVDLPDVVPDLADDDKKQWAETLHKAINQLRKKSPSVEKFLEDKPKEKSDRAESK